MSALFQRCQPAPEVGIRRASADEQESTNRHVLIRIHSKLASTMWQIFVTEEQQKRNAGSGRWGWFISIMVA
ncbi:hypothetical protein CFI14_07860 [Lactiplantibacillus pentosus]|nr:hypothetical protein CFK27_10705 [Lactiplantibacillus pentosus]AYG41019.1 hypothetical protein CFI14_07860 [Lactiplantibacillus pentosus]